MPCASAVSVISVPSDRVATIVAFASVVPLRVVAFPKASPSTSVYVEVMVGVTASVVTVVLAEALPDPSVLVTEIDVPSANVVAG